MKEGTRTRPDGGLSRLDRYLRALSDEHRRRLLYYLDEHEVADVERLAKYIADTEVGRSSASASKEDWSPIRTQLHHQHLPRLDEYGIVDYDERSKDVRLANVPQTFRILLQLCHIIENPS